MNKYLYNKARNNKFLSSNNPTFPQKSTDKYIISRMGDRLDLLAREFYGNENRWWVLASANNLGKGNLNVPAGLQIRIPFPISDLKYKLEKINER